LQEGVGEVALGVVPALGRAVEHARDARAAQRLPVPGALCACPIPPPSLLLPLPVSLLYTHSLHCRRCARCAAWGRGAQPWFSTPVLQWLSDSLRARQVTSPVMWEKTMALMMERGYEQGYELGPGKVVAGIIKPPPPPSY